MQTDNRFFAGRIFMLIAMHLFYAMQTFAQHPADITVDDLITNLPIVIIDTDGQEIPDEPKITAHMGIIWNGEGEMNHQYDPFNDYDGWIGIEVRGQSSQMFPKKSWGFETRDEQGANLNVPVLGMPAENDWILYAPYSDKSMLRNMITFEIARSMGGYCTRTVFCEVILNGQYEGVYVMMEKIKRDDNRVDIAKLNPDEISGDDLTGGYIVKVDKIDPDFEFGEDGWLSVPDPPFPNAMHIIFQYFYPKADEIVPEQKTYIQNYITSTENAITETTFNDPDLGYNQFLNTASFVDHLLLNELSKEVDKYRYSTYFFKEKDSDGGKLFSGPAWDFNLGYANVDYWPPGVDYTGWNYTDVEPYDWSKMFWWKRLMQDSYFRNLAKTRYLQLRENEISNGRLEFVIDSLTDHINDAQERNYERWPILGTYVWPNYDWQGNTYEDEVEYFESWLFNRLAWMDYNLPGVVIYPAASLLADEDETLIKLTDDYFCQTILENEYFTLNSGSQKIEIDSVVYQDAATAKIFLADLPEENLEISVTISAGVLNTWDNLTTNTIAVGVLSPAGRSSTAKIYSFGSSIHLQCDQPELLGRELMVFDLSGQLVRLAGTGQLLSGGIQTGLPPGIYLYHFLYDGENHAGRVFLH